MSVQYALKKLWSCRLEMLSILSMAFDYISDLFFSFSTTNWRPILALKAVQDLRAWKFKNKNIIFVGWGLWEIN